MDSLTESVLSGAGPDELEGKPVPAEYLAAHLRAQDVDLFRDSAEKDVRKSLHVGRVPMPELAPDEVLVAVMAGAINYNTVWSALFEPIPTFKFLSKYAKQGRWESRHDQPYQVVGSDASGVIVRRGSGVRGWSVGDHVVVSPVLVDDQEPATHADGMLSSRMLAWGFETNFGGLAHYAVARASQLIGKPRHLSWEEAACNPLCAGTAYRMLVSPAGARIKQGDIALIWGATGGLGGYAVQFVRNGGGIAVGVVGSEEKAELSRKMGCDVVINRAELGFNESTSDDPGETVRVAKRLGSVIRKELGEDPHVVFDYVGKATFATSVYLARRGGLVVTCGSSTGFHHQYDNRYLWMNLKRIIGSHGANLQEQWETNRLISMGRVNPMLSRTYPLQEVGEAVRLVQTNSHVGKVGVLCLAPEEGLGITDPELRARIGEESLRMMRVG
ncbi:crotonyl-CoA carboxylase/reductase [Amycolatopsis nigrescens]|uniref:crotonyl-CoA carboxylase/reductase n=1 Tax=Amycolatopsis nigrescens TaxID=381445 RepID=UPI0003638FD7|nr:crotonyl-CoA carboxylase/reductase [Amycolatopsis nigrescens]